MTSDAQIESRRRVADEAALWLLTLQSEVLSPAQRAEFVDWLRASPLHISELLWACQVQRNLATWKGWQHIAPLEGAPGDPVVRFLDSLQAGEQRRSWSRRRRGGVARVGRRRRSPVPTRAVFICMDSPNRPYNPVG